jgi:hypothetical protein
MSPAKRMTAERRAAGNKPLRAVYRIVGDRRVG